MQTLTYRGVLEEMVAELAERRRTRAAYLALARAILNDDHNRTTETEQDAAA